MAWRSVTAGGYLAPSVQCSAAQLLPLTSGRHAMCSTTRLGVQDVGELALAVALEGVVALLRLCTTITTTTAAES